MRPLGKEEEDEVMKNKRKRPRRPKPVVEIVGPTYQPSKAEVVEKFDVQPMTLEEAARKVMTPVDAEELPF